MQRRDVREPDERLGVGADGVEVEVRNELRGAVAALERLHDVDLGVREEGVQIGRAAEGVTGDVVVALPDPRRELHAVALRLPPLDATQHLGAAVVRTRGRGDADRAAVRERRSESRRVGQGAGVGGLALTHSLSSFIDTAGPGGRPPTRARRCRTRSPSARARPSCRAGASSACRSRPRSCGLARSAGCRRRTRRRRSATASSRRPGAALRAEQARALVRRDPVTAGPLHDLHADAAEARVGHRVRALGVDVLRLLEVGREDPHERRRPGSSGGRLARNREDGDAGLGIERSSRPPGVRAEEQQQRERIDARGGVAYAGDDRRSACTRCACVISAMVGGFTSLTHERRTYLPASGRPVNRIAPGVDRDVVPARREEHASRRRRR